MVSSIQEIPDNLDLEAEFHASVKAAAQETMDVFKEDPYFSQLLMDGDFDGVHDQLCEIVLAGDRFDAEAVLEAADDANGLQEMAVDAALFQRTVELMFIWGRLIGTGVTLPTLTWPVIKVKKPSKAGKKRKSKQ